MDSYKPAGKGMNVFEGPGPIGMKELLETENIDWEKIKEVLQKGPQQFEELLFKIHYKRKKELPVDRRSRILNFLSTAYLITNDIRYFNEFLWFYDDGNTDKKLMDGCMERFNSNLDADGCHPLSEQLKQFRINTEGRELNKLKDNKPTPPLRICLVGFPPFFGKIIKELKDRGHHVEQFFLPYHPDRKINRLLKFRPAVKLIALLSGNKYSYKTLDYDYKDERIGEALRAGKFDIGFHKLNFIIKENIFNAFRIGLLNDHWGYLPLLRGKSTIAYSLLLKVPVISSIHFINKGIDSGPIAGYQYCDYEAAASVKEVRNIVRKTMPERIISAIQYAGSTEFTAKENIQEAGVTFYEIHPWLNDHINARILKQ